MLVNGPGTCVPICLAALVYRCAAPHSQPLALSLLHACKGLTECCRLVLWRRCWLVYVESIARVDTLSLSGKILYRIADQMFVQWPQLQHKYPRALCVGRLY